MEHKLSLAFRFFRRPDRQRCVLGESIIGASRFPRLCVRAAVVLQRQLVPSIDLVNIGSLDLDWGMTLPNRAAIHDHRPEITMLPVCERVQRCAITCERSIVLMVIVHSQADEMTHQLHNVHVCRTFDGCVSAGSQGCNDELHRQKSAVGKMLAFEVSEM